MTLCSVQYLTRVMVIAGVSDNMGKLIHYCETFIGESLNLLWDVAISFAETLREHVFSTDYVVLHVFPQADFNPSTMTIHGSKNEEVLEDNVPVLCSVELGLKRETNVSKPGETVTTGSRVKTDVIVKNVVLFEREMEQMLSAK